MAAPMAMPMAFAAPLGAACMPRMAACAAPAAAAAPAIGFTPGARRLWAACLGGVLRRVEPAGLDPGPRGCQSAQFDRSEPGAACSTDRPPRLAPLSHPQPSVAPAGGAQDAANFRANIAGGHLPLPSDVSFEGLASEYRFDTRSEG